jgi:hypothetical protein
MDVEGWGRSSNFTTADPRSGIAFAPDRKLPPAAGSALPAKGRWYSIVIHAFIGAVAHSDMSVNRICEFSLIQPESEGQLNGAL